MIIPKIYRFGVIALFLSVLAAAAITTIRYETNPLESAGVCIFKGPATYGGFFGGGSSDGIPLRNINVTAVGFSKAIPDFGPVSGITDRTGCFIFDAPRDWNGKVWYNYNGSYYEDQLTAGLILRDNVP